MGGISFVLMVELRDGESQENLLARFRKMVQREGILREAKSRRHFLSNREATRLRRQRSMRRRRRR